MLKRLVPQGEGGRAREGERERGARFPYDPLLAPIPCSLRTLSARLSSYVFATRTPVLTCAVLLIPRYQELDNAVAEALGPCIAQLEALKKEARRLKLEAEEAKKGEQMLLAAIVGAEQRAATMEAAVTTLARKFPVSPSYAPTRMLLRIRCILGRYYLPYRPTHVLHVPRT